MTLDEMVIAVMIICLIAGKLCCPVVAGIGVGVAILWFMFRVITDK